MTSAVSRKIAPPHAESLLGAILDLLTQHEPGLARGWFSRLQQADFDGGVLRVRTENESQAAHLRTECLAGLVAAAQDLTGRFVSFEFSVAPAAMVIEAFGSAPREPSFAGFVEGPSNRFARAAVIAATESPGEIYNPLFLHGPIGTGKTHLLRAAAAGLRERLDATVFRLSAESWTAELVTHLESDTLENWRQRIRGGGALIIDDVHELADRPRSLDELFHAMNVLIDAGRQLIFASVRAPTELAGFPDRLVGRFSAGLVASLDVADKETRFAILQEKARTLAIEIPDEVVRFLATDSHRPLHNLLAMLTRLDAMSRMEAMPISMEMARRAVSGD